MGLVAAWHFSFLCLQLDRIESIFSNLFRFPAFEKRTPQFGGKYSLHHLHVRRLPWCGGIILTDANRLLRKQRIRSDYSFGLLSDPLPALLLDCGRSAPT